MKNVLIFALFVLMHSSFNLAAQNNDNQGTEFYPTYDLKDVMLERRGRTR